jgi:hypothetical protein
VPGRRLALPSRLKTPVRCTYAGCTATSDRPGHPGWTYFSRWRGIADGLYCPTHAEAIEPVVELGAVSEEEEG